MERDMSETAVAQWYQCGLSNKDAKELIGHVPGVLAYGTLKSYAILPERAKDILRTVYRTQ